jgi:hypothetical protein
MLLCFRGKQYLRLRYKLSQITNAYRWPIACMDLYVCVCLCWLVCMHVFQCDERALKNHVGHTEFHFYVSLDCGWCFAQTAIVSTVLVRYPEERHGANAQMTCHFKWAACQQTLFTHTTNDSWLLCDYFISMCAAIIHTRRI